MPKIKIPIEVRTKNVIIGKRQTGRSTKLQQLGSKYKNKLYVYPYQHMADVAKKEYMEKHKGEEREYKVEFLSIDRFMYKSQLCSPYDDSWEVYFDEFDSIVNIYVSQILNRANVCGIVVKDSCTYGLSCTHVLIDQELTDIENLISKHIAGEPFNNNYEGHMVKKCGCCGMKVWGYENYCPSCGQALDWIDEDE